MLDTDKDIKGAFNRFEITMKISSALKAESKVTRIRCQIYVTTEFIPAEIITVEFQDTQACHHAYHRWQMQKIMHGYGQTDSQQEK